MAVEYRDFEMMGIPEVEWNLESELEKVIPENVLKADPNLVYELKTRILDDFVLIDRTKLQPTTTTQTAPLQFPTVKPGDLITAALINRIMRALEALDQRLTTLEGTTPTTPSVMIFEPNPSRTLRIGDKMVIQGKNFGAPEDNTVVIDQTVTITEFETGSNSETLIIGKIKPIANIPTEGRLVKLTVRNKNGYASTQFNLAQPIVTKPTGTLKVTLVGSPSVDTFEAGKSYIFTYKIAAVTTADETYILKPAVDKGWSARVVDNQGKPITPEEIFILKPPSITQPTVRNVKVEVAIPARTGDGTVGQLSLTVTSRRNPTELKESSEESPVKVGGEPPESDKIDISLDGVFASGHEDENGFIVIPANNEDIAVTFSAAVPEAGKYEIFTPTFKSDPNNLWEARVIGARTGISMAPPTSTFSLFVKAKSGAPRTKIVLKVASEEDASISGDKEFDIRTG
jgi:hypothetical protein